MHNFWHKSWSRFIHIQIRSLVNADLSVSLNQWLRLLVWVRVASRSHVRVASRSQGTNFATKIFNFGGFDAVDAGKYHVPFLLRVLSLSLKLNHGCVHSTAGRLQCAGGSNLPKIWNFKSSRNSETVKDWAAPRYKTPFQFCHITFLAMLGRLIIII